MGKKRKKIEIPQLCHDPELLPSDVSVTRISDHLFTTYRISWTMSRSFFTLNCFTHTMITRLPKKLPFTFHIALHVIPDWSDEEGAIESRLGKTAEMRLWIVAQRL